MGTNDEPLDNQQVQTGQVEGDQGQPAPETTQPVEVEVEEGKRVSLEELKSGYMKDADYRRKTAELAEERRRLQQERDELSRQRAYTPRSQANLEPEEPEEVNPYDVLAREVIGMKTFIAKQYLSGEIDRLAAKYPDADKNAVFSACWSNPNAIIENEMGRSHETIQAKIAEKAPKASAPATLDEFFKLNPKAKAEYDRRVQEDFLRKKAQKSTEAKTVSTSAPASAETVKEANPRASDYRDAGARLKERLKEQGDESF